MVWFWGMGHIQCLKFSNTFILKKATEIFAHARNRSCKLSCVDRSLVMDEFDFCQYITPSLHEIKLNEFYKKIVYHHTYNSHIT